MNALLTLAFVMIVELRIEPTEVDEFLAFANDEIIASRSFEGNLQFEVLVDPNEPGTVVFFQRWKSQEAREKYWAWRESVGDMDKLNGYLLAPPKFQIYKQAVK